MNIEEVIDASIVALYTSPHLSEILVLKGGSGLRLLEGQHTRTSIDADFSIVDKLDDPDEFFAEVKLRLEAYFLPLGYEIFDFKFKKKPKEKPQNRPEWWGGWECLFKLVSLEHVDKTIVTKRRNAFIPEGANSSVVELDISEHEYCGSLQSRDIDGVEIKGYSRELLVLEKFRALCQQHPDYPYRLSKNRSRDLYDIYQLTQSYEESFIQACRNEIDAVFGAKDVPLKLLRALWDQDFVNELESGFDQVINTVQGSVYPFETYVEHSRFLLLDLDPNILDE